MLRTLTVIGEIKMNIETIEIPLEEYRMLLRESEKGMRKKIAEAFAHLASLDFDNALIYVDKLAEYKRELYRIEDKLYTHAVKFTADDIPF